MDDQHLLLLAHGQCVQWKGRHFSLFALSLFALSPALCITHVYQPHHASTFDVTFFHTCHWASHASSTTKLLNQFYALKSHEVVDVHRWRMMEDPGHEVV